jgi:hypothetical protein
MEPKFDTYSVHQEADCIVCFTCGKTGTMFWDQVSRSSKSTREMAGIDRPFFERLSRKAPYPIELICRNCGGVALTAFPSTSLRDRREYN